MVFDVTLFVWNSCEQIVSYEHMIAYFGHANDWVNRLIGDESGEMLFQDEEESWDEDAYCI